MPPNKLKQGYGDGVCQVLHKLCQLSLQSKFRFKKPVIKDDGGALDDEGEEMGDDMDGGAADMVDMAAAQNISDDEEIEDDFGANQIGKEDNQPDQH